MATIITINRKLVKKFIKKLFSNPVKSQMQSSHMERMHMWSSLKILIEDLRLSSNVASLLQKIENYCQKNILISSKKPVATKLYGNDALSDLWLLTLVAYEKCI